MHDINVALKLLHDSINIFIKRKKNKKEKVWAKLNLFIVEHTPAPRAGAARLLERNPMRRSKEFHYITRTELMRLYRLEHQKLLAALRENEELKQELQSLKTEDPDQVWESMK